VCVCVCARTRALIFLRILPLDHRNNGNHHDDAIKPVRPIADKAALAKQVLGICKHVYQKFLCHINQ